MDRQSMSLQAINLYQQGYSTYKIAEELGISQKKAYTLLKESGCTLRSNKINSKKYFCNDEYFSVIDSAQKAYWLGFIAADGYIQSKNRYNTKYIGVTLGIEDIAHLEQLKKAIEYTGDIKVYKYHGFSETVGARLLVQSDKMYDDLKSHNVVERKSNIIQKPDIDPKYYGSYILGYFDGDGSISVSKDMKSCSIKFIGTDSILDFIIEYLCDNGIECRGKVKNKRHEYDIVKYLSFGGTKKPIQIMDLLYSNVDGFSPLYRKFYKYRQFEISRVSE